TSTQNLFVMEGDRLLMAVQANVGRPGASTPHGHFTIYSKQKERRRASEPDAGYPMAYWCEFAPAYGFHEGFVWPVPHTHGCVRLHREAAARLFALTRIGTPVIIESSLPEDKQYGNLVLRLDQSHEHEPDFQRHNCPPESKPAYPGRDGGCAATGRVTLPQRYHRKGPARRRDHFRGRYDSASGKAVWLLLRR